MSTKAAAVAERRREIRRRADGEVWMILEGREAIEIKGRLLDSSAGGFRAVHEHVTMRTGNEVWFRHPHGEGRARVVWNRILPQRIESGFIVLE